MTTKTTLKNTAKSTKQTKRVIIDYSQNFDLDYILSQLEGVYFAGLSKAEITKLAIIELFKKESKATVPYLSDEEEASLSQAMTNRGNIVSIPKNTKLSEFLLQNDFED